MSLQLGGFPLVEASKGGLVSAVRVLLVNGTDVNQRNQVSCCAGLLYHTHFDTTWEEVVSKCFMLYRTKSVCILYRLVTLACCWPACMATLMWWPLSSVLQECWWTQQTMRCVCVCAHERVGFVCVAAVPVAVSVLGLAASAAQQI